MAIVTVVDLTSLAEGRVGLVKEQNRSALLGSVEDSGSVLFGLADVIAGDLA